MFACQHFCPGWHEVGGLVCPSTEFMVGLVVVVVSVVVVEG
jgi:hypothetical protein